MSVKETSGVIQTEPNFGTRVLRVMTVWGLGTGTAVALALTAGLLLKVGVHPWVICTIASGIAGITAGGGAIYLDYVKANMVLAPERGSRAANAVSAFLVLVFVFVSAALLSLLMVPILLCGLSYIEAKKRSGLSLWQSGRMFIGSIVPRIAA